MADPNKKFEEQIEELLDSRLEDLNKYLKAYKGEKDDDEEEEIECEECGGTGEVNCPRCGGDGQIDCEDVEGEPKCEEGDTMDCPMCQGEGKLECDSCDGVGAVENPDYVEPMSRGEAEDELREYPLSIETKRYVDIDLSTGGPYDYLRYFLDSDNDVEWIEYHAGWASDSAVRTYRGGSKFDTLVEFYEFFKEGLEI